MILSILGTIHLTQDRIPEEWNITQFKQSYLEDKHNSFSRCVTQHYCFNDTNPQSALPWNHLLQLKWWDRTLLHVWMGFSAMLYTPHGPTGLLIESFAPRGFDQTLGSGGRPHQTLE